MKQAAILASTGIGDGLLMMIAAQHLKKSGYHVTMFHNAADELIPLFEGIHISTYPPLKRLKKTLQSFDYVLVENTHFPESRFFFTIRNASLPPYSCFFFKPSRKMRDGDYLFNTQLPMTTNLSCGCEKLLGTSPCIDNNLSLPHDKNFRKYSKRIVIHPTSSNIKRNWSQSRFLQLAKRLQRDGYQVTFCIGPTEEKKWGHLDNVLQFFHLKALADYIYESGYLIGNDSGIGHLASNLKIPTLTITNDRKHVRIWRPGWAVNHIITPLAILPRFIIRKVWKICLTTTSVYKAFKKLSHDYERR